MNGCNYMNFGSVAEYGGFDQVLADGNAVFAGMNDDERGTITTMLREDIQNAINNRYRLNPRTSYVAPETRAADPDFWNSKR